MCDNKTRYFYFKDKPKDHNKPKWGEKNEKFINGNFPDTTDDPRLYEE